VEHVEEHNKPVLYLVRCCILLLFFAFSFWWVALSSLSLSLISHPSFFFLYPILQVFEFLSTDLKKWMDRHGKGPQFPLDPLTIKVKEEREGPGRKRVRRTATRPL
jgi:hypothetical protein